MKRTIALTAALFVTTLGTAPAFAASAPACIQADMIDHTTVVSPREILFSMKDGKTYSSHLRSPCLGLSFNQGFAYATSVDTICGGTQRIRTLPTKQICTLGEFERVSIGDHG